MECTWSPETPWSITYASMSPRSWTFNQNWLLSVGVGWDQMPQMATQRQSLHQTTKCPWINSSMYSRLSMSLGHLQCESSEDQDTACNVKLWKALKKEICQSLLWWDYSEGGSKYGSGCLNFDRGKKVVKISRELPYKEIHVVFWRLFCVSQNSNNLPDILTPSE